MSIAINEADDFDVTTPRERRRGCEGPRHSGWVTIKCGSHLTGAINSNLIVDSRLGMTKGFDRGVDFINNYFHDRFGSDRAILCAFVRGVRPSFQGRKIPMEGAVEQFVGSKKVFGADARSGAPRPFYFREMGGGFSVLGSNFSYRGGPHL